MAGMPTLNYTTPTLTTPYLNQMRGVQQEASGWEGLRQRQLQEQFGARASDLGQELGAAQAAGMSQLAQRGGGSRGAMAAMASQNPYQALQARQKLESEKQQAMSEAALKGSELRLGTGKDIGNVYAQLLAQQGNLGLGAAQARADLAGKSYAAQMGLTGELGKLYMQDPGRFNEMKSNPYGKRILSQV